MHTCKEILRWIKIYVPFSRIVRIAQYRDHYKLCQCNIDPSELLNYGVCWCNRYLTQNNTLPSWPVIIGNFIRIVLALSYGWAVSNFNLRINILAFHNTGHESQWVIWMKSSHTFNFHHSWRTRSIPILRLLLL